jgi:hypothetical protein
VDSFSGSEVQSSKPKRGNATTPPPNAGSIGYYVASFGTFLKAGLDI